MFMMIATVALVMIIVQGRTLTVIIKLLIWMCVRKQKRQEFNCFSCLMVLDIFNLFNLHGPGELGADIQSPLLVFLLSGTILALQSSVLFQNIFNFFTFLTKFSNILPFFALFNIFLPLSCPFSEKSYAFPYFLEQALAMLLCDHSLNPSIYNGGWSGHLEPRVIGEAKILRKWWGKPQWRGKVYS